VLDGHLSRVHVGKLSLLIPVKCIKYAFNAASFLQFIFIFYFVKYEPIKYAKTYHYPGWGEVLGFAISGSSMIWVPGYAIYYLLTTKGSLKERLRLGITPVIKPRTDMVIKSRRPAAADAAATEVEMSLVSNKDLTNHV
jgi:hypothetical protein